MVFFGRVLFLRIVECHFLLSARRLEGSLCEKKEGKEEGFISTGCRVPMWGFLFSSDEEARGHAQPSLLDE